MLFHLSTFQSILYIHGRLCRLFVHHYCFTLPWLCFPTPLTLGLVNTCFGQWNMNR